MMLTVHLGYMAMLSDKIDKKLLVIKIIEASKSLRGNMAFTNGKRNKRNIKILSYWDKRMAKIKHQEKIKQLQLVL